MYNNFDALSQDEKDSLDNAADGYELGYKNGIATTHSLTAKQKVSLSAAFNKLEKFIYNKVSGPEAEELFAKFLDCQSSVLVICNGPTENCPCDDCQNATKEKTKAIKAVRGKK